MWTYSFSFDPVSPKPFIFIGFSLCLITFHLLADFGPFLSVSFLIAAWSRRGMPVALLIFRMNEKALLWNTTASLEIIQRRMSVCSAIRFKELVRHYRAIKKRVVDISILSYHLLILNEIRRLSHNSMSVLCLHHYLSTASILSHCMFTTNNPDPN